MKLLRDIYRHRELFIILVQRNLKIRYKSSALGFCWTLISPILLIAIYAIFLRILRFTIDLPVLVTGIVVWQYLAMCAGDSLHTVVGNVSMVKKSAFPRLVLPLAMAAANFVNLCLSLAVVGVYLLFAGRTCGPLYLLPLAILAQLMLVMGLSALFAALNVYFRDMEHIIGIAMMAWFFITPVIYPVEYFTSRFGQALQQLYFLNPMAGIVAMYRAAMLNAPLPEFGLLGPSLLVGVLFLVLGVSVFQQLQRGFADII